MSATTIQNIAVIGLGTIGHSVVQMFAVSGCYVRCFDPSSSVRDGLENRIRDNLNQMVNADLFIKGDIETALAKITVCDTEQEALVGAEFVSEAASEELGLKQTLFSRMEKSVDAETILASNTSTHPMTDIARLMQHPDRAIVTHPFNPPHITITALISAGCHLCCRTAGSGLGEADRWLITRQHQISSQFFLLVRPVSHDRTDSSHVGLDRDTAGDTTLFRHLLNQKDGIQVGPTLPPIGCRDRHAKKP